MFRGGRGVGRRPRVGTLLVCLALVPLVGLTWLALSRTIAAMDASSAAQDLASSTDRAVLFVNLEAAVDQEQTWAQAAGLAESLGIAPPLLSAFVGFDLPAALDEARQGLDGLADRIDDSEFAVALRAQLGEARRADLMPDELADAYEQLRNFVAARSQLEMRRVLTDAAGVDSAEGLVDAALVVEATASMRASFTGQVGAFFSIALGELGIVEDPLSELALEATAYDNAGKRVEALSVDGSRTAAVFDALPADPNVGLFLAEVEELLADVYDGDGLTDTTMMVEVGATSISPEDLTRLGTSFAAAGIGADSHVDLVVTAGVDVLDFVDSAASSARATAWWVMAVATIIGLITVSVTLATARAIVRPLRLLSDAADSLRRGDLAHQVPLSGPREVRSVGHALAEAVDNLRLGERQADALAVGSLDDPVFDVEAKGHFGSSLQAAVERLRVSLAEREEYRRRLSHQAAHDGLTGVPNRRAVIDHLEQAVARTARSDATLAAFFVDVDGFKSVNDIHGHPAGDALLRTVAQRLGEAVRGGDLVGRLGGDEFLVVAEPVTDVDDAYVLAERIRTSVTKPVSTPAGVIEPTISIGVAVSQAGRFTADELIRDADLAVYLAKERGRDRTEVCDDHMRQQASRESDLDREVREALDGDQFVLHYQPIVAAADARPVGVEALIRWEHPERGLVAPADFIDFAERSDLVIDIDRWVIASAVEQLRNWRGVPVLGDLALSINVSGRHLRGGTLPSDVEAALAGSDVDPALLVVEVTESALLDDLRDVAADLDAVRALGVRVAIDDFGTGYTSLAHLRTLPLDILKLDQSFVATLDTDDRSIVGLVIDTAHLLDLEIVIEGVETASQAAVVRDLGCDFIQGFHFGMPVPGARLAELLGPSAAPHAGVN
ncbi:MAG: EAL domain-containing protein [Acidimicrobiales bacterium]